METQKQIILDIETRQADLEDLAGIIPAFKAPANYKDPEKIQGSILEQQGKWLEKAALSAVTGRVMAVGMLIIHNQDIDNREEIVFVAGRDGGEAEILAKTFMTISGAQLYTWNGSRFDLPFLFRRGWAGGVPNVPTERVMPGGFKSDPNHTDLMTAWCLGVSGEMESLDTVAKTLKVGKKSGSGAHFSQLYKENPVEALAYLSNDLLLTAKIADKLNLL